MNETAAPKCVVLSCLGGAQGELGVVRCLGRMGVHVVLVSEYEHPISRYSKYTREFVEIRGFYSRKDEALAGLIAYAQRQAVKPVIFPTADPDLEFLSQYREQLAPYYHMFVSRAEIIENYTDKGKFSTYALSHGYPIPATSIPDNLDDVVAIADQVAYPVILKPVVPMSWGREEIRRIVNSKKAIRAESKEELLRYYRDIAVYDREMVIQEYIPGRDDRLYSLHVYIDRRGEALGWFVGRKIRTFPAYAGIGCYVISVHLPELVDIGIEILRKVDYTGLALLQFKQDPRTGDYKLLEINPRVSSWNQLATECGVNLPLIAWRDTAGLPVTPQRTQQDGVKYFFFEHDLHAFLEYRREGDCTLGEWLASYRGRKVFQYFATDDLRPWWIETRGLLQRGLGKVLRRLTGRP